MVDHIEVLLEQRGEVHGEYPAKAALIQSLKYTIRDCGEWHSLSPDMQESLDMIMSKVGRIMFGNESYKDHWDDIAGYATLISRRLEG